MLPLSHECIVDMLGARRSSVTLAAGIFKAQGLSGYARGKIHLLDVKGLEAQACECLQGGPGSLGGFCGV